MVDRAFAAGFFAESHEQIIDEEQRSGVSRKEALEALRDSVHLLIPIPILIPRSLNMATAGLRDLSIIDVRIRRVRGTSRC